MQDDQQPQPSDTTQPVVSPVNSENEVATPQPTNDVAHTPVLDGTTPQVISSSPQFQQPAQDIGGYNSNVLGRRVWAYLIDLMPWIVAFIIAAQHFGQVNTGNSNFNANLTGLPFAIFALAWLAYYILLEWLIGGSLGKLIVGLQVRNEAGAKLTFVKSLVRNLLRLVDGFPYIIPNLVGFIIASTNDKKQRLGDKAAHTLVVKADKTQPTSLFALLTLLILTIAGTLVIAIIPASKANKQQSTTSVSTTSNNSLITAAQITAAEQASNTFVSDIENGNYEAAYQLTAPAFQASTTETQTASYYKNLKGSQAQLTGATPINSDKVQVAYGNYTDAQGRSGFMVLIMQYVNNQWLVYGT